MPQRPSDELQRLSEHVLYEAQMLFGTADFLRAFQRSDLPIPWAVEMAMIESFAMHARVLIEFLWCDPTASRRRQYPDDAFAEDYLAPGEWKRVRDRVPMESTLVDIRSRAGAEIAHLTYKRSSDSSERAWEFDRIAIAIGRAFKLFLKHADAANLMDGFEDKLRAAWPISLDDPMVISPYANVMAAATTPLVDMTITHPGPHREFQAD